MNHRLSYGIALIALLAVTLGAFFLNPSAVIEIQPSAIDFGDVEHNRQLLSDFRVKNNGHANLILKNFNASCGCINVMLKTDDTYIRVPQEVTIPPGQIVWFRTGMTSGTMKGPQHKQIVFETNLPSHPLVTIGLRANLFGRLHAFPPDVDFGTTTIGTPVTAHVILTDGGRMKAFVPKNVETASESFTAKMELIDDSNSVDIGGIPILRIIISFVPETSGKYEDVVNIYSVDGVEPEISIPVRVNVLPQLVARPPAMVFPDVGAKNPFKSTLTLLDSSGAPVPVVLVKDSLPEWLVETEVSTDEGLVVGVEVADSVRTSGAKADISVRASDPSFPSVVNVPVFVIGTDSDDVLPPPN